VPTITGIGRPTEGRGDPHKGEGAVGSIKGLNSCSTGGSTVAGFNQKGVGEPRESKPEGRGGRRAYTRPWGRNFDFKAGVFLKLQKDYGVL
jgi:hypothetical protein